MNAAAPDELFERSVTALLEQFAQDDATPIARIHSYEICEDGRTLLITLELVDGRDVFLSCCPGEPLTIHHTDAPPPPKPRHLFVVRCEPAT